MEGRIPPLRSTRSRPSSRNGNFTVANDSTLAGPAVSVLGPAVSARFNLFEREVGSRNLAGRYGDTGNSSLRMMSPSAKLAESWHTPQLASSRVQPTIWGSRSSDLVQDISSELGLLPMQSSSPGTYRQTGTRVMPKTPPTEQETGSRSLAGSARHTGNRVPKTPPLEQGRSLRSLSINAVGIGHPGQISQAGHSLPQGDPLRAGQLVPQGELVRSRVVSGGGLYLLEDRPPQSGIALRRGRQRVQNLAVPVAGMNRGSENGQDSQLASPMSPLSPGLSPAYRSVPSSVPSWGTRATTRRYLYQEVPDNLQKLHISGPSFSSSSFSSAVTYAREAPTGTEMSGTGAKSQRPFSSGTTAMITGITGPTAVSSQDTRANTQPTSATVDSAVDLVEALKQALIERFGDLDKAFQWFDWNNRARVSRFMWETGMRMLNIDKKVKSKSAWFFGLFDKGQNGDFSVEEWREIFCYNKDLEISDEEAVDTEAGSELRDKSAGVIRQRLLSRVTKLKDVVSKSYNGRRRRSGTISIQEAAALLQDAAAARRQDTIEEAPVFIDDSNAPTAALPNLNSLLRLREGEDVLAGEGGISPACATKAAAALWSTDVHRAEEVTILQDIERLNLKGIRALAYILTAKCGSLDLAFQWLDSNSSGHFTRVHWDTAVICLHLDVERLTGMHPTRVFLKMSRNGCVTKEAWDEFFTEHSDERDNELIDELKKGFRERMGKELHKIWKADDNENGKSRKKSSDPASQNDSSRPGLEKKGSKQLGSSSRTNSPPVQSYNSEGRGSSSGSKAIKIEVQTAEAGHAGHAGKASLGTGKEAGKDADSPKSSKSETGNAECSTVDTEERRLLSEACDKEPVIEVPAKAKEPSPAEAVARLAPVPSPVETSSPAATTTTTTTATTAAMAASSSSVSSEQDFEERMRKDLKNLSPDECKQYKNLNRPDRRVLQQVANSMSLWSNNEGQEVSVYKEGPQGAEIRQALAAMRPGDMKHFEELPQVLHKYARSVAEGLDLFIASGEEYGDGDLTVFNLNGNVEEFTAGITSTLLGLKPGQVMDVPNVAISKERQDILLNKADELGYFSHSFGDAATGVTSVGHLSGFRDAVRKEIGGLKPGDLSKFSSKSKCSRRVLGDKLPALARQLVHVEAVTAGCVASNVPDRMDDEIVQVLRLGHQQEGEDNIGIDENTELEEELQEQVSLVFDMLATGSQGKKQVLLRNTDLFTFAERTARLRGRQLEEPIMESLEQIFDDTLELQVDMGSRYTRGITLDYFQVFLIKTANALGWSLHALLMALVEFYNVE